MKWVGDSDGDRQKRGIVSGITVQRVSGRFLPGTGIQATEYGLHGATRMLGYLYRISKPRIEDVVDEMLAILSDRDRLVEKHQVEDAQAKLNEVYHYGLGTEDE